MIPIDSINWNIFNPNEDIIDLEEVQITATYPYVRETVGGSTY